MGWVGWCTDVANLYPSVLGADRAHDQGAATPPSNNGADGTERASTGGGPPGVRVRRQPGQEDTQQWSEVSDYEEAPGMVPNDDLWERLVHPPQLHFLSQVSREVINLPHLDIQGGLGGELGVQQQHGILQEPWGESWWEEIVCGLRQGNGGLVTTPNWCRTYQ